MAIGSGVLLPGVAENPTFPILRPLAYTTGLGDRPTCDNNSNKRTGHPNSSIQWLTMSLDSVRSNLLKELNSHTTVATVLSEVYVGVSCIRDIHNGFERSTALPTVQCSSYRLHWTTRRHTRTNQPLMNGNCSFAQNRTISLDLIWYNNRARAWKPSENCLFNLTHGVELRY